MQYSTSALSPKPTHRLVNLLGIDLQFQHVRADGCRHGELFVAGVAAHVLRLSIALGVNQAGNQRRMGRCTPAHGHGSLAIGQRDVSARRIETDRRGHG